MVKLYKKTFRTERRLNFKVPVHVSVNCLPVDMCMQIQVHTCTSSFQYTLCILDYMIFSPFPVNVQLLLKEVRRMINGQNFKVMKMIMIELSNHISSIKR